MVTEKQQKIFDALAEYDDLEQARENADKIALKTDSSATYVRRMIGRKEDEGTQVKFKVAPKVEPEEESEEIEDEDFPEDELEDEPDSLAPPDDWDFDVDAEDEPEPDSEVVREISEMDLTEIISKENCAILIATPFRMASDWTGFEGWALTDEEQKRISPMFRAILLKYLPTMLAEYFAEIIFAVVIIQIIGVKAKAYRDFSEEQEKTLRNQRIAEEMERDKAKAPEPDPTPEPVELTKDSTTPHWMADGRTVG